MTAIFTELLVAGACYSNSIFQQCALHPQECPSPLVYRSPLWLSKNDSERAAQCATESSIHSIAAMGRCDVSSERFICTSHRTNCRSLSSFKPLDPDCTLLHDFRGTNSFFTSSFFGVCQAISSSSEDFCVWQVDECPISGGNYNFDTADPSFTTQEPICQCDQVKTGACVTQTDDFFCAVSQEVCDSEPGYSYVKALDFESRLNITCKLCDTLPPPPEVRYAEAGACVLDNTFTRCALLPSDCTGVGETFFSPRGLASTTISTPNEANVCLTGSALHDVRVGRCASEMNANMCVSDKTACTLTQSFQPNDDMCNLVFDLQKGNPYGTTHFGHCTPAAFPVQYDATIRESYCAWSSQECESSSQYALPLSWGVANPLVAGKLPNCRCDDVRTGACISRANPNDRYCAVKAEACDLGFEYKNVRDLEEPKGPNMVCHLCKPLAPVNIGAPSGVSTNAPTQSPTRAPTMENNNATINADQKLSTGAFIGITIAGLVWFILLFIGLKLYIARCDSEKGTPVVVLGDEVTKLEAPVEPTKEEEQSMEPGQSEADFVPQDDKSII